MSIDKFGRHPVVRATHQINIDKFGRHTADVSPATSATVVRSTFPRAVVGNYDFENKRLCNVQNPLDEQDCATRNYVLKETGTVRQSETKRVQQSIGSVYNNLAASINAELRSVENTINSLKQRLDKHDDELDKVIPLESKLKIRLDALEANARTSETLLKQEVKQLEARVKVFEKL